MIPEEILVVALTPVTRLGACEITALIGAGGMGEVSRARDRRLQREATTREGASR